MRFWAGLFLVMVFDVQIEPSINCDHLRTFVIFSSLLFLGPHTSLAHGSCSIVKQLSQTAQTVRLSDSSCSRPLFQNIQFLLLANCELFGLFHRNAVSFSKPCNHMQIVVCPDIIMLLDYTRGKKWWLHTYIYTYTHARMLYEFCIQDLSQHFLYKTIAPL